MSTRFIGIFFAVLLASSQSCFASENVKKSDDQTALKILGKKKTSLIDKTPSSLGLSETLLSQWLDELSIDSQDRFDDEIYKALDIDRDGVVVALPKDLPN